MGEGLVPSEHIRGPYLDCREIHPRRTTQKAAAAAAASRRLGVKPESPRARGLRPHSGSEKELYPVVFAWGLLELTAGVHC